MCEDECDFVVIEFVCDVIECGCWIGIVYCMCVVVWCEMYVDLVGVLYVDCCVDYFE